MLVLPLKRTLQFFWQLPGIRGWDEILGFEITLMTLEEYLESQSPHGKNLTIDNLCRRNIWVLDWCFMCKRAGGNSGSPLTSLCVCQRAVVFDILYFWDPMGYALQGFSDVGMLEEEGLFQSKYDLERSSFVLNVAYLAERNPAPLRIPKDIL